MNVDPAVKGTDAVPGTPVFPHVVVAVDLTPAGEALVDCLGGLRELGARKLTLVHVATVDYPLMGGVAHLEHHRKELEAMAAELRGEGFEVAVDARHGPPAAEVLRAATESGGSLVLVGSRSRSRLHEAFIGSVALGILERSTLPVLLQPIDAAPDGEEPRPRVLCCHLRSRIVLATDFSGAAGPAEATVEALVRFGACRVALLHVLEGGEGGDPARREEAWLRVDALASRLREAGATEVDTLVVSGDPAGAIAAAAAADPDTLVVMGTQGRGFLGRVLLGSVSRKVARGTRAPLLLVPAARD